MLSQDKTVKLYPGPDSFKSTECKQDIKAQYLFSQSTANTECGEGVLQELEIEQLLRGDAKPGQAKFGQTGGRLTLHWNKRLIGNGYGS